MAKNEYAFQVSKDYKTLGMLVNIRADNQKDLIDNIESMKYALEQTGLLKKDSPVVRQQDADISQDPDDVSCPAHPVVKSEDITYEPEGNYGPYYWHWTNDERYKTERFPEPPWKCFCKEKK